MKLFKSDSFFFEMEQIINVRKSIYILAFHLSKTLFHKNEEWSGYDFFYT